MIQSFSKLFSRRVGNALRADKKEVAEIINSAIPTRRGEFNVYNIYPLQYPWNKYANSGLTNADLTWWEKVDKLMVTRRWQRNYYRQLGLLHDDLISDEDAIVIEAINRLPKEIREARERRIAKAFDLQLHSTELPESEWTKMEDDVPYLQTYINWVQHEIEERDAQSMVIRDFPIPPVQAVPLESYVAGGEAYTKRYIE